MTEQPLPLGFRAEILEPAARLLRSGESCALVGVGSSGKSNVARHLARPDVVGEYFAGDAALVVYLNCKPFAHRAPPEFYLHVLDELAQAASPAERASLETLWQSAQADPALLARRNLDHALAHLERAGAHRIVLALDDCDDLLAQAPPGFFSDLRGLRDNHKLALVFVTLTRREPVFLRASTPEYEEFFELISAPGHTLPIGPYLEADALLMLQRLAARQTPPRPLPASEARRLYALTGGHAGLLRSLFFATQFTAELAALSLSDTDWPRLAEHADVDGEARKIWDSLEPDEQDDLRRIASGHPPTPDGQRRLARRGLIRVRLGHPPEIFAPLFERCLLAWHGLSLPTPAGPAVEFTGVGRQVRVDGHLVTDLLAPEHALLRCLADAAPEPCSRASLVEAMRLAEQEERGAQARGDPLRRLDEYLRQLRAKLGPAGRRVQPAGDGYQLI